MKTLLLTAIAALFTSTAFAELEKKLDSSEVCIASSSTSETNMKKIKTLIVQIVVNRQSSLLLHAEKRAPEKQKNTTTFTSTYQGNIGIPSGSDLVNPREVTAKITYKQQGKKSIITSINISNDKNLSEAFSLEVSPIQFSQENYDYILAQGTTPVGCYTAQVKTVKGLGI